MIGREGGSSVGVREGWRERGEGRVIGREGREKCGGREEGRSVA